MKPHSHIENRGVSLPEFTSGAPMCPMIARRFYANYVTMLLITI